MARRFCQRAWLKPEKVDEYRRLHANAWPGVLKTIEDCNLRNYRIDLLDTLVVSTFEYVGDDYDADMRRMEADPITQEWWTHTKPCFLRHEDDVYYEDMEEIFRFDGRAAGDTK